MLSGTPYSNSSDPLAHEKYNLLITDLQNNFSQWFDNSRNPVNTSECSGITILGGPKFSFQRYIEKTYEFDDDYTDFKLSLSIWAIGRKSNSSFAIYINEQMIRVISLQGRNTIHRGKFCDPDSTLQDELYLVEDISVNLPCTTKHITVRIYPTKEFYDNPGQFLGFRDLNIQGYNRCPVGCACCFGSSDQQLCTKCSKEATSCNKAELLFTDLITSFSNWKNPASSNETNPTNCRNDVVLRPEHRLVQLGIQKSINLDGIFTDFILYFTWYAIDDWSGETFRAYLNDQEVYTYRSNARTSSSENYCGSNSTDIRNMAVGYAQFDCGTDELVIKFNSTISTNFENRSWAITNISLYGINRCDDGCKCCLGFPYQMTCTPKSENIFTDNVDRTSSLESALSDWKNKEGEVIKTSLCGSTWIVGGYGITSDTIIQKVFILEEAYTNIELEFDWLAIDKWNGEYLYVYVNGHLAYSHSRTNVESEINWCGKADPDVLISAKGSVEFECATNKITIEIITSLDNDSFSHSYGIANLKLHGTNRCQKGCSCCYRQPVAKLCTKCETGAKNCSEEQLSLLATDLVTTFDNWEISNSTIPLTKMQCGDKNMLVCPSNISNKTITKDFELGGSYSDLLITFDWTAIDNWKGEYLFLYVNDNLVYSGTHNNLKKANLSCGEPSLPAYTINRASAFIELNCSVEIISLKFVSTLPNDGNSHFYGLSNLQIKGTNRCNNDCKCCLPAPNHDICIECIDEHTSCANLALSLIRDPIREKRAYCPDPILGGPGISSYQPTKRTYTLPGSYSALALSFGWEGIDSWEADEKLYAFINQQLVYTGTHNGKLGSQKCGSDLSNYLEQSYNGIGVVELECATNVTEIMFQTNLDQSSLNEAYGIRDIHVYGWSRCPGGCECCSLTESSKCTKCFENGFYFRDNQCLKCHPSCATCSDGTPDSCLSCPEGFYLTPEHTCISPPCPIQWYQNDTNHSCERCGIRDCIDCSQSKNECLKCGSQTFLDLETRRCVDGCPIAYHQNQKTRVCERCKDPNCEACFQSAAICTTCLDGYYVTKEKTCQGCSDDNCLECDESQCYKCAEGYKLKKGKCHRLTFLQIFILTIGGLAFILFIWRLWAYVKRKRIRARIHNFTSIIANTDEVLSVNREDDQSIGQKMRIDKYLFREVGHSELREEDEESLKINEEGEEEKENEENEGSRGVCLIDLENKSNIVFLNCFHVCVCASCAQTLMRTTKKCPVCRKDIVGVQRIKLM